jgi:hypothetical protein
MNVVFYTAIFGNKDPIRTDIQRFTEKSDFHKFVMSCMDAKIFKVLFNNFLIFFLRVKDVISSGTVPGGSITR